MEELRAVAAKGPGLTVEEAQIGEQTAATGRQIAVGAFGPTGADWSTTYIAERITWPATLGPADRPDFSQPLYAPLGRAAKVDGRWTWTEPFVRIVPAQIR